MPEIRSVVNRLHTSGIHFILDTCIEKVIANK